MFNLSKFSNEVLLSNYAKIVDAYNLFLSKNDTDKMSDAMEQIQAYEAEIIARGLNETNYPKHKAKPLAPTSQATTATKTVQLFTPAKVERGAILSLKTSHYFLPKSRFSAYQNRVQKIGRYFNRYSELTAATKTNKKEVYRQVILLLSKECKALVQASVKEDMQGNILKYNYSINKGKDYFSISTIDKAIAEFIK